MCQLPPGTPLAAETLLIAVYGGGLSHLSFGMDSFNVPGSAVVRIASVALRFPHILPRHPSPIRSTAGCLSKAARLHAFQLQ